MEKNNEEKEENIKKENDDRIIIFEEEKKPKKTKRKKTSSLKNFIADKKDIILTFLLTIILVVACLYGTGKLNFDFIKKVSSDKEEKIELKHVETSSNTSSGVYVTDVSEVVENAMPSIVAITSKTIVNSGNFGPSFFSEDTYAEGAGSGVIIQETDDKIYILTNNHVVEDSSELIVQFIDEESTEAKIVGTSERKDIAVISVDISNMKKDTLEAIKIATIGSSDDLKVGNGIIAIGNALGYGQSVTTGVVSALNREVTTDEYTIEMIQIDAAINGGNSGGALLNSKGELVGINTAKYSSSASTTNASVEGMGFAIPITDVEDLIEDLMNGKNDSNGVTLGIEGYMTNSGNLSGYNLPVGFYVSKILESGSAYKTDLEIGDIITAIDGKEITKIEDLKKVLNNKNEGDSVELTIKYVKGHEYQERNIKVEF